MPQLFGMHLKLNEKCTAAYYFLWSNLKKYAINQVFSFDTRKPKCRCLDNVTNSNKYKYEHNRENNTVKPTLTQTLLDIIVRMGSGVDFHCPKKLALKPGPVYHIIAS